jgi:hypothetical protein
MPLISRPSLALSYTQNVKKKTLNYESIWYVIGNAEGCVHNQTITISKSKV